MKLHGTDDAMVCSSHLHSFVTAKVEHAVALRSQLSYRPFRYIIVYWIISVFLIGKDSVPKPIKYDQTCTSRPHGLRCLPSSRPCGPSGACRQSGSSGQTSTADQAFLP